MRNVGEVAMSAVRAPIRVAVHPVHYGAKLSRTIQQTPQTLARVARIRRSH